MQLYDVTTTLLWATLVLSTVLGGVVFGASIWRLLAPREQGNFIDKAIGPIWDIHMGWLLLFLRGLSIAFPDDFPLLLKALFTPFTLILLGLLARVSILLLSTSALQASAFSRTARQLLHAFSLLTPFLLGVAAAAVATAQLFVDGNTVHMNLFAPWTLPIEIVFGALILALSATLAAVFLAVKAEDADNTTLMELFRWRAISAGSITVLLCAISLILAPAEIPVLWHGMVGPSLFLVILTLLFGLLTFISLFQMKYRRARAQMITTIILLLWAWAVALHPYLAPPYLKIEDAAPNDVLWKLLLGMLIGAAVLLLASLYLPRLVSRRKTTPLLEKP